MRLLNGVAVGLLCLALTACASTSRLASYNGAGIYSDAEVVLNGHTMTITTHPKEPFLLAQVTMGSAAASGFITGLTLGLATGHRLDPRDVDAALARFVAPLGCTMAPSRMIGENNVSFEAQYTCPAGVDLRAIMLSQRAALKRGEPLKAPG